MAIFMEADLFINRELSWLDFNHRVLDLAKEKAVPLGEQLRFAAIYGSNLDEFFMIRVGSLYDQTLLKSEKTENKTGMTPKQQLAAIMPKVREIQGDCDKNVTKLFLELQGVGFKKVDFTTLDKEQESLWKNYFLRELFPVLSPQIIDRRHPFPFLRNRELYVGALLKPGKNEKSLFGLLPISAQYDRVIMLAGDDSTSFALVEELVLHFASLCFGKADIADKSLFRVTRNADIDVEEGMFDHDIDYRVVMGELLKKRRKLAAVRLQFWGKTNAKIRDFLCEKLLLPIEQCFYQKAPLDLSFLFRLASRLARANNDSLYYPTLKPIQAPAGYQLYDVVQQKDVLICYPFQSIRPFVQMLQDAARDPDVISIKMTLYRVADDSKIVEALLVAAENGKEVVTIVELRARFDEQNNIDWSHRLEQAGCTVIYGFTDYKVHSKLLLITKKTKKGFGYISQIGTGNYNEKTSEQYTDISYLTSKGKIGEEIAAVFNNLAVEKLTEEVENLIVAPLHFKSVLLQELEKEIQYQQSGGQGKVIIKCNSISDKKIIETLSSASAAGVQIQMIVRGICCVHAGLLGLSENIHVRSIVGRYLEHSRIYSFGDAERRRIYIASGDFLTRNTERRVEVGVKVEDLETMKTLVDILDLQLADTANARVMQPDGSYAKVLVKKGERRVDSQMEMYGYLERHIPEFNGQYPTPPKQLQTTKTIKVAPIVKAVARPIGKQTHQYGLQRRRKYRPF